MQIYLINLDRHVKRLVRMTEMLKEVAFERISAVDGRDLDGPENWDPNLPSSAENLDKYNRACVLSHRLAWEKFLKADVRYCCILEDDIFISPEFPKFTADESWIPSYVDLLKIETNNQRVFLSRRTSASLDRSIAALKSPHMGTAAYILTRRGAEALLQNTVPIDRPADKLVFGADAIQRGTPVIHQLSPALCMQAKNLKHGILFPEMESAIQGQRLRKEKSALKKIRTELMRPLGQSQQFLRSMILGWRSHEQRCVVPFE